MPVPRRLPIGAELQPGGGVHFRVWAPASPTAAVEFQAAAGAPARVVPLTAEANGYFSGLVAEARAGDRYKIKLARGAFPDPASRFQPDGPHGPSEIVDPTAFKWTDQAWRGPSLRDVILYELHLGTFTPEGTWAAAMARLPDLVDVGVTVLEVMPIADFPGKFGWGYDGVNLYATCRLYGRPDDARAFVDRAHALGLGVILDVVYNHVGPDGNYLREFSPHYFHPNRMNEWGDSLNFDEQDAGPVREFFVRNAAYWIDEFHFDGLRLDATQQIHDKSPVHVLAEVTQAVRGAAGVRQTLLVAESETQDAQLVRPFTAGGQGIDMLWNDDFHHATHVAATGRREAYYRDYWGTAQEFVAAAKHGFLFQGQRYEWQNAPRGRPSLDLVAQNFVIFLENHDQVANSLRGVRLHQESCAGQYRALTALMLLQPQIPLLFQGQEFAASTPFLYFADHPGKLGDDVANGRREFLRQFATLASPEIDDLFPDPRDPETFARSRIDWDERTRNAEAYRFHRDLIRVRRSEPLITRPARLEAAVLHRDTFVLRYLSPDYCDDRLLVVNLGADLQFSPAPEPLLAPCAGRGWRTLFSTEAPEYGGNGTPPLETQANWLIPGHATVLLAPSDHREIPTAWLHDKWREERAAAEQRPAAETRNA